MQVRLQEVVDGLDPLDREILALRHYEELTNQEAAEELGITPAAASKRYIRALERLKAVLANAPGCPMSTTTRCLQPRTVAGRFRVPTGVDRDPVEQLAEEFLDRRRQGRGGVDQPSMPSAIRNWPRGSASFFPRCC